MDDALPVRGIDGIENLPGQRQGFVEGQRPGQRLAVDVLHDQVVRPDVEERADMRMIQAGDRTRLALEALVEGVGVPS